MNKLRSHDELIEEAKKAREKAQATYSNFKVGSVVQTASGNLYYGCNIESSSYGLTMCAERVAVFNAIAAGDLDITHIAIVTDTDTPASPCGACRQILIDYAIDSEIILNNCKDGTRVTSSKALLPHYFSKSDLL